MAMWPQDTIREFLTKAEMTGKEVMLTESNHDAERLRFAVYNFRRATGIGMNLTISVEGRYVVAMTVPSVALVNPEQS